MASSDSEKYLPEDLLINIFRRVDVKSILRCTCVCKTWYHVIIHSATFVKDHLTYQKISSDTKKYVLVLHYNSSKGCKLLSEPLFDIAKHSKLYYTPKLFEKDVDTADRYHHLKIHGMLDGLLCFSTFCDEHISRYYTSMNYYIGDNLYLWNPICRKAKKLPELKTSNSLIQNSGVSFGYYGDDYKVIVISCGTDLEYVVSVYSLGSNCWNIIRTKCYHEGKILDFSFLHHTKFIDGIAYMITATWQRVYSLPLVTLCFDLRDETLEQLNCSEEVVAYGSFYTIETYGETIALMRCGIGDIDQHLAMWTLLRDKVSSKSSWEKKLNIKLQPTVCSTVPVGFLHNGKYMIRGYSMRLGQIIFLLCDLETSKVTEYRSENFRGYDFSTIIPNCVESLLLLNEDSVDPFVHSEMESSCSSILFTMQKDILPEPEKLSKQNRKRKE